MADTSWLDRLRALSAWPSIGVAFPKLVNSGLRWSMEEVDMLELAAMISGAAVVLNSGSTVSIDALMHDKPVLITAFDADRERDYWDSARRLMDYSHLKKLVDLGGVVVTRDFSALEMQLGETLFGEATDPGAKARALAQECFSDDGLSTQRVVDRLASPSESGNFEREAESRSSPTCSRP
jgi:hypothetical protein